MGWRESLFKHAGPGMLSGSTLGAWFDTLLENRFRVGPRTWVKGAISTVLATSTSACRLAEEACVGGRVRRISVEKPIFVLGHWRSGTTHLHNLLSVDERFAYPQFLDVMSPHTFLTSGSLVSQTLGKIFPSTRFELDNVPFSAAVPCEDEYALAIMTGLSPYLSWVFPEQAERYDHYLSLEGASDAELATWAGAMKYFMQKITYKYGKRLVLKSPPHTSRIRQLLRLFPDAKFVHIHRHPYSVYRSTKHLHAFSRQYFSLQHCDYEDHERILSMYETMYDAYFEQKELIPEGSFADVAYDDLVADPTGQLGRIYEELDLPDFGTAQPAVERYLAGLGNHERGNHAPLSEFVRRSIVNRWRRTFDEWNYSTSDAGRKQPRISWRNGVGSPSAIAA